MQQCLMFIFGEDETVIPHLVFEPYEEWYQRVVDWASMYGLYAMYLDGQGSVPEDIQYIAIYETSDENQNHAVVKISSMTPPKSGSLIFSTWTATLSS